MLETRLLQPADQPKLEAFLIPRLASSMILLSNSRSTGLAYRDARFHGTYVGALHGGVLVGVAAHYWNGNVIVQAKEHAAELCRAALRASTRPLVGLLGPNAQVAAILDALQLGPELLQLDSVESLFQLSLSALCVPEALRTGAVRARRARLEDLDVLAPWRAEYSVEALHERDTRELQEQARAAQQAEIRAGRIWVAEHDGAPVAMTGFNSAIAEAVQIGGVYTPKPLRSRGYARAAVAQSLLDARAEGAAQAMLFTGDDNHAAQRAYRALGFERVGDYRISTLHTPRAAAEV